MGWFAKQEESIQSCNDDGASVFDENALAVSLFA